MRKGSYKKRKLLPDAKYKSSLVAKLINMVMLGGKKSLAERIVYNALNIVKEKVKQGTPLEVLEKAVDNVRPLLEVKSRRIGGATYQVPVEVGAERALTLALRWIRDYAHNRKGKPMEVKLADELLDAYKREGLSIKKKEDTHRMAEANKAFAHYRW